MNTNIILLLAKQFWKNLFSQKAIYLLLVLFALLTGFAAYNGFWQMKSQNELRKTYQQAIRKSWESNPDKHPHRMAHYGSFALRFKHPLSMFDGGMESYTGNAVFLEAHKQNSIIYSEASFSTAMLRLGEMSLALLLHTVLPLILIFLGYTAIAADRENGTLRILLGQGVSWKELLIGRSLGLLAVASLFFVPVFIVTGLLLLTHHNVVQNASEWLRLLLLFLSFTCFFVLIVVATLWVSAASLTSKLALSRLLSFWLLLSIVLPRSTQALGAALFPIPPKVDFETAAENEILRQGDSHNPDDPFYKNFKDSVLAANHADNASQLSFNLGGLVGKKGEELSSMTYAKYQDSLFRIYARQIEFSKLLSLFNPFAAMRFQSMALSGTDFPAYLHFQQEAEQYRYKLVQQMNDWQIAYIPNNTPKEGSQSLHIDKAYWQQFPDIVYHYTGLRQIRKSAGLSCIALLGWLIILPALALRFFHKLKLN